MSSEFDSALARERLSALADGELDAAGNSTACDGWRCDAELRRDWHAWHLIGDVLRSDDLACEAGRDLRLLAVVRERLASEPVVLAPAPLMAAAGGAHRGSANQVGGRWRMPGAIAAGVALVVGTFVLTRAPDGGMLPAPGVATLAGSADDATRAGAANIRVAAADALPSRAVTRGQQAPQLDRQMIRDAGLDRYLDAHKQFAGSSALGVPSAFLSGATVDSSAR